MRQSLCSLKMIKILQTSRNSNCCCTDVFSCSAFTVKSHFTANVENNIDSVQCDGFPVEKDPDVTTMLVIDKQFFGISIGIDYWL